MHLLQGTEKGILMCIDRAFEVIFVFYRFNISCHTCRPQNARGKNKGLCEEIEQLIQMTALLIDSCIRT